MDPSSVIQIVCILVLIMLSAFFSSAETSLVTVNRLWLRSLADQGNKRAQLVLKVIENQSKMLSAILIGNNIVNLGASAIATLFVQRLWGEAMVSVGTGVLTLMVLIFGEISPKSAATAYADKLSMVYAPFVYMIMKLLTPVIFIINLFSRGVMKLMHLNLDRKAHSITEDELRTMVDASHEEGVIESEERRMINNVFDLGDSMAKDIMVPRIDMSCVDVNATYEELMEIFRQDMFTRMPVYEETTDNVVGIINMKDILLYRQGDPFSIRDYMRRPHYTYEYKKTSELLMEMKESPVNVTIVLDEYGATAGMITLEDMLEEIVGEIRDEYDEDEQDTVQKLNDREYLIEGSIKLDDLNELLELGLESEDYDSLGGFIIERLDHLPQAGESIEYEGMKFVVQQVDKKRIEKVHLYLPEEKQREGE